MISYRSDFEAFVKKNAIKKKDIAKFLGVSAAFITVLCDGTRQVPAPKLKMILENEEWDRSMFGIPTGPPAADPALNERMVVAVEKMAAALERIEQKLRK